MRRLSVVRVLLASMTPVLHLGAEETMKAVIAHEYGSPQVLRLETVPIPSPREDEASIRVVASGVNPADPLILGGKYAKEFGTHLPLTLGYDIAGTVEEVGSKVTRLKKGDAIYGYPTFGGGWAEYCLVKEGEVAPKPKSLSFAEAAAVPVAAITAWQALVRAADLQPGQTVLIHGGSGGVGSFAIQIAKARGARVIATASTANQDLLKRLGADVAIDYSRSKFEDFAHEVDAVLDPIGGETLARSYQVVKPGGVILCLVARPDPARLAQYHIRAVPIAAHGDTGDLTALAELIDAGKIKPIISQVRPLAEAPAAAEQAETHHTRGKVVLQVMPEPGP